MLLGDGAVKFVTAGSCYSCWVCLFGAFVEYSYIRFVVVSSLINYYGPVIVYCLFLKTNKMHKLNTIKQTIEYTSYQVQIHKCFGTKEV